MLPAPDAAFLTERSFEYSTSVEGGAVCVVVLRLALPPGYNVQEADLLVRLPAGYPDLPPDMWWFDPPVRLANGQDLSNTNVVEPYLGRQWQRWSRHFSNGQWQSGVDGLQSYLALIRHSLERSVPEGAK